MRVLLVLLIGKISAPGLFDLQLFTQTHSADSLTAAKQPQQFFSCEAAARRFLQAI
jgi:hypothetical protein